MATQPWFPTPMYFENAVGTEFINIQNELFNVYNQLKFLQIPNWGNDTHCLSENAFARNVLSEKNCTNFLGFLDRSLNTYLDELEFKYDREYTIASSWFTLTKPGQYAHRHDHGGVDLSGVYYLQTNTESGNLYFQSPLRSLGANLIYEIVNTDTEVAAQEGLLGVWPGLLEHGTYTNNSELDRISISFNIQYTRNKKEK